jgi:hypothetical protein
MVNITDDNPYFSERTSTDKINSKEVSKEDIDNRIKNNLDSEYNKNYVHDFRKDIPPFEARPKYYGGKDSTYEVFNVLEAWKLDKDFYLGNVIKYLARAGKKTFNNKEDLEKALVYLQRRIDTL